jgi:O-acetyl-ADP-ribose deacetylase (regulator of RNase III)
MTDIRAVQADITTLEVGAVVNAANVQLQHGGGVALAIARAGGPIVQLASDRWVEEHGPLESGVAAVTTAGDMPSQKVVHVAGPVFRDGQDNERLLRAAVDAALEAAADERCRSVALPAISAGIYGYPLAEATRVIAGAVETWVLDHPDSFDEILLVGYDDEAATAFRSALDG